MLTPFLTCLLHYNNVIIVAMASQITSLTIVYSAVYSGAYQRKHQSFASLAFVRGIHRWPVNSPHKRPVTRKMFAFEKVIMIGVIVVLRNAIHLWFIVSYLIPVVTGQCPQCLRLLFSQLNTTRVTGAHCGSCGWTAHIETGMELNLYEET